MRFFFVVALALLLVGSDARISKKKDRKLQDNNGYYNQNYGGNGYYNNQGGDQQAANYEQYGGDGQYNYDAQQDVDQEGDYNNYDAQDVEGEQSSTGAWDTDDAAFHYEDLTLENYEKLLEVHDKMEAYRLATILLIVLVVFMCIYTAILQCRLDNAELQTPFRRPLTGSKRTTKPIV